LKKIRSALMLIAVLIAAGIWGIGPTWSFLTGYDSVPNPVTPGCNETEIIEEFPDTPPQDPEKNPVYNKKVQIRAPEAVIANVTGYIRARILYSNSDLGNAVVLSGMDSGWVKDSDGYYYYTRPVSRGQVTAPLFTRVSLDSSKVSDKASIYVEDFRITVYEESVQAGKCKNYKEAWNSFVPKTA